MWVDDFMSIQHIQPTRLGLCLGGAKISVGKHLKQIHLNSKSTTVYGTCTAGATWELQCPGIWPGFQKPRSKTAQCPVYQEGRSGLHERDQKFHIATHVAFMASCQL